MTQALMGKKLYTGTKRQPTPEEVTARLEESVRRSIANLTKEEAVKFLSRLSMYDEDGQLKKEY